MVEPTGAVVRITASATCGADLHLVRGTTAGMKPGSVPAPEAVGIFEEVGSAGRNFAPGEWIAVCSTVSRGTSSDRRAGRTAQRDDAHPDRKRAGTAFFGRRPSEPG